MITGIIDCGTNTFNLLVAEIQENKQYNILLNTKKSVKLGEGGLKNKLISPQAFQRGLKTFVELVQIAKDYKAKSIKAFATSAVRSTLNGPDFVKKTLEKTGVIIQVLNGDTEAQYIYKGVNLAMDNLNKPILIMDIGGGSTEFIIAENNQVVWKKSFDLGAARILQEFKTSDPITPEEIDKLKTHFKKTLTPLASRLKRHSVEGLIGCSGSFESLADMIKAQSETPDMTQEKIFNFHNDDFKKVYQQLVKSTEKERMLMPGLVEYRVDTIVYAAIFIRHIKKRFKIDQMYYSSHALKEGVLADMLSLESPL